MADLKKTEIAVVLDRSGSMSSLKSDMEGGFATFIADQKKLDGACFVSLYQFDDKYEVVYEGRPIGGVGELNLSPRGSTALLDGIGKTLTKVKERHDAMKEEDRPAAVVVLIITDGHENSSSEWSKDGVQKAIKEAEEKWKWQMVFLAADARAFDEAQTYGFKASKMGHVDKSSRGISEAYAVSSAAVGNYRGAVMRSATMKGGPAPELNLDQDLLKSVGSADEGEDNNDD